VYTPAARPARFFAESFPERDATPRSAMRLPFVTIVPPAAARTHRGPSCRTPGRRRDRRSGHMSITYAPPSSPPGGVLAHSQSAPVAHDRPGRTRLEVV